MSSDKRGCPKCGSFSPIEDWDKTTREVGMLGNTKNYVSAGADDAKMNEQQPWFICPVCQEEVEGLDLLKKEVK